MIVDVVVPARNEAPTVGAVVEACLGCAYARQVNLRLWEKKGRSAQP